MDNASKAIVIAGAVFIAIGLVGLGVYLFQSSARLTSGVESEVTAREIQTINATFIVLFIVYLLRFYKTFPTVFLTNNLFFNKAWLFFLLYVLIVICT